jgi:hypothetical protein
MNILRITSALATAAIVLGAITTSCKKYEEGPIASLTPRSERIANTWIISYAKEDGENVSDQFDQYELYMNTSGLAQLDAEYTTFGVTTVTSTEGIWSFQNDDENLNLNFDDDDQDATYRILRLTKSELWLKDLSRDLELHLLEK